MLVRFYTAGDAAAVAAIFNRAVSDIASRVYTPDQITAWLDGGMTADETQVRCSDGRSVWVAVDDTDTAIAFIDLEDDGHIDMLFCQPEWIGRGVASALYQQLETTARDRGMPRLYVEASCANTIFGLQNWTGEDGLEIMLPVGEAAAFFLQLRADAVAPCGLGARDTLRLAARP